MLAAGRSRTSHPADDKKRAYRTGSRKRRPKPRRHRGPLMQRTGKTSSGRRLYTEGRPFHHRHPAYAQLGQTAPPRPRLDPRRPYKRRIRAKSGSGEGGRALQSVG